MTPLPGQSDSYPPELIERAAKAISDATGYDENEPLTGLEMDQARAVLDAIAFSELRAERDESFFADDMCGEIRQITEAAITGPQPAFLDDAVRTIVDERDRLAAALREIADEAEAAQKHVGSMAHLPAIVARVAREALSDE